MNISFDVDGIVADFPLGFTRLAAELYPDKGIVLRGCAGREAWGFKSIPGLTENITLSNKEISAIWDNIYSSTVFWAMLPTLFTPADLESMRRFDARHNICWVTSRTGKRALEQTQDWIKSVGLPASERVYLAGENKGEFIVDSDLQIDVHIDDSPSQIDRLQAAGIPVVVRDWPYNRAAGVLVPRVYSLEEFEVVVEDISLRGS